jgi:glycosyltransferase involved in cell wall biosynthesis
VTTGKPGVLWVKSAVPWPLDQGNHFIAYNLIRHLHGSFDITFVVPVKDAEEQERARALEPFARVIPVPRTSTRSVVHRALWRLGYHGLNLLRYRPPEIFYENFGRLRAVLRREARSGRHALAFLHYWYLHPLLADLAPLPSAVLLHDCEPQRIQSEIDAHPERAPELARKLEATVAGHHELLRRATRVLFYSDEDLDDWVRRGGSRPGNAGVFPYMFAFDPPRERREVPGRVLFTGHMSYGPNVDAAVWFAREILPRVRERLPHATFRIAGKQPHPDVGALGELDGVEVTGYVDDMIEELVSAPVYAAPIRFGGGLKIKLLEAGGQACPVVATGCALRGFGLEEGRQVLRADEAPAFADAVIRLLERADERAAIGEALREALVARFSPEAAGEKVAALLREVAAQSARS